MSVLIAAITARLRNAPTNPREETGLNPNQPKNRIIVPRTPREMLCPGIVFADPSLLNLPMRGPITIAPARAMAPPIICTTPEPAKSTAPFPKPTLRPRFCNQPPPQIQRTNAQPDTNRTNQHQQPN